MNEIQVSAKEHSPTEGVFKRFFRCLFCWRMLRRCLFVLACLATLTGLFYAVENWRGKPAWEKCRRKLEAKGEVLDWNAYIPAPVPDDQNIFKAPRIAEWFVKGYHAGNASGKPSKSRNTKEPFSLSPRRDANNGPVLVAEVNVLPSDAPLPAAKVDAVLRFDDPEALEQAAKLIRERIGPCAEGPSNCRIIAQPPDQINPVRLVLQAVTVPTSNALVEFFARSPVLHHGRTTADRNCFQVDPAGGNAFSVSLKTPVYTAAGYLALSQPAVPDLDLLRQALERPCARIDSNYQQYSELPIPNFVRFRTVAQLLSQRAQCYLLLGQPEAAWHELALVRDLCRLLECKPTGNAPTIVQAMMDVAITELYTDILKDGLRLQVWREPELAAMQEQLKDVNLLPLLHQTINAERAGVCRLFETTPPAELQRSFDSGTGQSGLWETLKDPAFLFVRLAPRGWIYQNMCTLALGDQKMLDIFDLPNNLILPRKADQTNLRMQSTFTHFMPYTFLATMAMPNFAKAAQTAARNQTLVNQAFLACGLERYRLAHGQYPETLEALVPQFAEKLPHDIIGGQPLKYHPTADGQFVLYSVGWNEKDDGGVPGKTHAEGDWVWP